MLEPIREFQVGEMQALVYPDLDELGLAAAANTADILIRTVARKGKARMIVATGNSQMEFIRALASFEAIPWKQITVFHMDEYVGLPEEHPASFREWIRIRVEEVFHPAAMHYLDGNADPASECRRYAKLLTEEPIDLVCFGIGENGHIAFNDPGVADFEDPEIVKQVELDYACRKQQVGEGHFPEFDAVPTHALTLTIPALLAADHLQVVVPDARKAAAVRAAVHGPISTECPASILRTEAKARLFLDTASAALVGKLL